jgi:hypothetical protein
MAQDLFIKEVDAVTGKASMRKVSVLRSWQTVEGKQIYLHTNGVYGYKDGAPVKSDQEFDHLIQDAYQLAAARAWWERTGRALSETYYAKKEQESQERQQRMTPVQGDLTRLDTTVYVRRQENDRRKNAWSEPATWVSWFTTRPDWWGLATIIDIHGYRYKMIAADQAVGEDEDDEDHAAVAGQ